MVPPAGLVSLVATNLRWAHAQNGGEQARESRTRTRGRALVAPQGRALRGPRIRVVAEWPGHLDATTVAGAGKGSSGLTQDPAVT